VRRSLPHGHVAAVCAVAVKLGLPRLLGPACGERDLALIVSRVVRPGCAGLRRWRGWVAPGTGDRGLVLAERGL